MSALFFRELEQVFGWLLTASWQASALALLVLALQWMLRGRLNPRWLYTLWLLVIVRLLLPVLPESTFSLFQFAHAPAAFVAAEPPPHPPVQIILQAPPDSPGMDSEISEVAAPKPTVSLFSVLSIFWLAGVIVLLVLTWYVNRRFARQIANSSELTDPELLQILATAQAELGMNRAIRLVENEQVQSPAIMGLFQSTLLLPTDVRGKFDATELRLIFLHELAHLKRGDVIVQLLIALLQILHWFNPVLWFAFRRMRIDREPATDALVLSRAGEGEKERYGLMLIKLLEHFNQRHSLPTLVGILEDKDQFKRRFSLIARFTSGAYGWSMLGMLITCLLALFCLTKEVTAQSGDRSNTVVYRAATPDKEWDGWGAVAPPNHSPVKPPAPSPEEFELIRNDASSARTFSGKVVVQGPMDGVEVGLVSLVKIHWIIPDTYQWQPVAADGSFSITDARYLNASKALVVRGPNTPWTFLRYNFSPLESGKNIVLKAAPGKKVRITVSSADMEDLSDIGCEPFVAHTEVDDNGNALRRQRYDFLKSGDKKYIDAVLPLGEIALYIHHEGFANYYQVVDTQRADHFHFVLQPGGRLKLTVLDADGKPKSGIPNIRVNKDAPLSYDEEKTDDKGEMLAVNLVPGTFSLRVYGFDELQVKIVSGQQTDITLQDGKEPVIAPPATPASTVPAKADAPTAATSHAQSQPDDEAGKKTVKLEFKAIEIDDKVYQASQKKIDAAIKDGDYLFFTKLRGTKLLSAPTVLDKEGMKASLEIGSGKMVAYPTEFDNPHEEQVPAGEGNVTVKVPATPSQFASKELGITVDLTPSFDQQRIVLTGKFTMINFEGFIKSNVGLRSPTFSTKETLIYEAFNDRQTKAFLIPGIYSSSNPMSDGTDEGAANRLVFFITAQKTE